MWDKVLSVLGVVKPETLDAAGGVLEKTGKGVGTIVDSVGNLGSQHHQIAADANVREIEALAKIDDPQKLKLILDHKKAASGQSPLNLLAAATPLGPLMSLRNMMPS